MCMIASGLTISTSITARDPHSKILLATSLSTEHHSKYSGLGLNGHLYVSERDANEGSNNTNRGNNEGEVHRVGSGQNRLGSGGHKKGSADGFSEGTEEIGAYTSNITNIAADVVRSPQC
jgi:hypothetical protein